MVSLHQVMGPCMILRDLDDLGIEETLQYDPYEDKSHNAETFPMLDEASEVTPKWGGKCVNAETLLMTGNKMARGQVVCQKHDANSNPIGRSKQNPILDTHLYEVEFPGREMTELAANIIAESMYAQCDIDGNEYLLLEAFINHRKNGPALGVKNQKKVTKG